MADIYTGRLEPYTDLAKLDHLVLELENMAENKHYLKGTLFIDPFQVFPNIMKREVNFSLGIS